MRADGGLIHECAELGGKPDIPQRGRGLYGGRPDYPRGVPTPGPTLSTLSNPCELSVLAWPSRLLYGWTLREKVRTLWPSFTEENRLITVPADS